MPICPKCGKPLICTSHGSVVESFPDLDPVKKCNPKAAIWVLVKDDAGAAVGKVKVTAVGDKRSDKTGFCGFDDLAPADYNVSISLTEAQLKTYLPPSPAPQSFKLDEAQVKRVNFVLERKTRLRIKVVNRDKDLKLIKDIKIKLKETVVAKEEADKDSLDTGSVEYNPIPAGTYEAKIELTPEQAKHYKIDGDAARPITLAKGDDEELVFTLVPIVRIYIRLQFNDPDAPTDNGKARNFPPKFAVRYVFTASPSLELTVGAGGIISTGSGPDAKPYVEVERKVKTLALVFPFSAKSFVVCEKRTAAAKEELLAADDAHATGTTLADRLRDEHRVFRLPTADWDLKLADWTALHGSGPPAKYVDKQFKDLDDEATTVGDEGQPVQLILDAHWQYVRIEYFDRFASASRFGNKAVTSLPLILEGYAKQQKDKAVPDAADLTSQSNWTIGADDQGLVQCLPWIIRREAGGTALNKPDRESTLRFTTDEPRRFVKTEDASRVWAAKLDSAHPQRHDKPSRDRLRYYDLPEEWRSTCYFCRLSDTASDQDLWEEMATKATAKDKPLIFSLDDMVMTDQDLVPIAWHYAKPEAADNPNDRVALFSHKFKGPDWTAGKSEPALLDAALRSVWVPPKPQVRTARGAPGLSPDGIYLHERASDHCWQSAVCLPWNYIADYPDWTRLVIAQGNLHDVFDQRTSKAKNTSAAQPVGARAAVRWVESATATNAGGNAVDPRPALAFHPSGAAADERLFVTQPLFQQNFCHVYYEVSDNIDGGTGRTDPVLLRCSDIDGDNEVGTVILFMRVAFAFDTGVVPANGLTEAQFGDRLVKTVADRWNGRDAQGKATEFLPKNGAKKLKLKSFHFLQLTPPARAHLKFKIVAGSGRAFVNSWKGEGALGPKDYQPTGTHGDPMTFTAAHEFGHFGTQPDDYGEKWSHGSYDQLDFTNLLPGLPYVDDEWAMMCSNLTPRGRNYWFAAEWARHASDVELKVKHGADADYWLPAHPGAPAKSYTGWPYRVLARQDVGGNSLFDLALYGLGNDKTANDVFPNLTSSGGVFDGVLSIVIKLKFHFFFDTDNLIRAALDEIDQHVRNETNHKFYATGKVMVDGVERTFAKCLVQFQLRYMVLNFSGTAYWDDFQDDAGSGSGGGGSGSGGKTGKQKYEEHIANIDSWTGGFHTAVMVEQPTTPPTADQWASPPEAFVVFNDVGTGTWEADLRDAFYKKFRSMIGLAENTNPLSALDVRPIVRKILTDGEAFDV